MHADINRPNELSGVVIGCGFAVLNTLGVGFLSWRTSRARRVLQLHSSVVSP
jgi:hypothetical protein